MSYVWTYSTYDWSSNLDSHAVMEHRVYRRLRLDEVHRTLYPMIMHPFGNSRQMPSPTVPRGLQVHGSPAELSAALLGAIHEMYEAAGLSPEHTDGAFRNHIPSRNVIV